MAKWMRCAASMTLQARGSDRVEYLWPDLVVNVERELAPGYTIADAIAGREDCFEPAGDPKLADDAAPSMRQEDDV